MRIPAFLCLLLLAGSALPGQAPMPARSAAELQHLLRRTQVLGSVLYIAAHPDDENTRMISYLARGRGYRTAYLSLTRGDGGQNLIGTEQGPDLGILRTQELLAARRIDGGEQFFTRAYDFGFSKGPEETLAIWNKEVVLGDVVWAIRTCRPDVIITRFATPEKGGGGHGHHTASAMLAHEAFALAGDPNAYPEQLAYVEPWQPRRLFWNNYWVFRNYQPNADELSRIFTVDVGGYDPLLGKSYGEIASEARSMHRCQAFGTALQRGSLIEYLDQELGDPASGDFFSGIATTWDRVPGGKSIGKLLARASAEFNPENPATVLPVLLEAYREMEGRSDYWYDLKRRELQTLIAYCAGLWFEVHSEEEMTALGDTARLVAEVIRRSETAVRLREVRLAGETLALDTLLPGNTSLNRFYRDIRLRDLPVSQPYWLREPQEQGMYRVADPRLTGQPEGPAALLAQWVFDIAGTAITFETPVVYRYVDRSVGELYQPFRIAPPLSVRIEKEAYLFTGARPREVKLQLHAYAADLRTTLRFEAPAGWEVVPPQLSFDLTRRGEERSIVLRVTAGEGAESGHLRVVARTDDFEGSHTVETVAYDHIPTQTRFPPAQAQLIPIDVQKQGERIAYLMGSGDDIPQALAEIGYAVDVLAPDEVSLDKLRPYDAVIAGIRAYNTQERMPYLHEQLMAYVEQGGTYIVQYNTTFDLKVAQPGPFPLSLSRDRVTDETAPMTMLIPDHPVFTTPNALTAADFEGWIQERGLYFPGKWDERYQALLACNDPGEAPLQGALLVARHGKGYYFYTGLSFFRELPAGVPGAYRLFANMLSIGKTSNR
ncbi:MAG: PIG-L family deacetylase [Bacteroidia bacterium]